MSKKKASGKSEDMELWGTLWGWSKKLGIPEDMPRDRFKGLPTQECVGADPDNSEYQIVTEAYPTAVAC